MITDNRNYTIINYELCPYYDDGYIGHISKSRKFKNGHHRKKRVITHYQYRMYRTWKHNREHQWK